MKRKLHKLITQTRLKELLKYDPISGLFAWRIQAGNRIHAGDLAGSQTQYGYWSIFVDGHRYQAHRLAWLYMTGDWPKDETDHINGNRVDNRFQNLREASKTINQQNQRKPRKDNTTGFLGVSRNGAAFMSQICVNGEQKYLGTFKTPELAHIAYLENKRNSHFGCTI